MSIVLHVCTKLRVAHSCRSVLVFIHPQFVNKSITSIYVGVCALSVLKQYCKPPADLLFQISPSCFEKYVAISQPSAV